MKKALIIGLVALAIALIGYWMWNSSNQPGPYDAFASCLAERGVTFYGAFWCPHCQDQKQMFGKSAKLLPYTECSLPNGQGQNQLCNDAGIESYPTWEFADGSRVTGTQQFSALAERSGCPLP